MTAGRIPDSLALRLGDLLARLAPQAAGRALRAPCFVIGCGRSGSTALGDRLRAHPDLAVFPSEANRSWHPAAYPAAESTLGAPPFWRAPVGFTRASVAARRPRHDARLRARLGAFRLARRRRILVNKSAMIHFMIPEILTLFPDARLVHLVRDGRAVAYSYGRRLAEHAVGELPEVEAARASRGGLIELLRTLASFWALSMDEIDRRRAAIPEGRFLEVRYEDLCDAWEESTQRLTGFLGVPPGPLQQAPPFRSMNERVLRDLDPSELARVCEPMNGQLRARGYVA